MCVWTKQTSLSNKSDEYKVWIEMCLVLLLVPVDQWGNSAYARGGTGAMPTPIHTRACKFRVSTYIHTRARNASANASGSLFLARYQIQIVPGTAPRLPLPELDAPPVSCKHKHEHQSVSVEQHQINVTQKALPPPPAPSFLLLNVRVVC